MRKPAPIVHLWRAPFDEQTTCAAKDGLGKFILILVRAIRVTSLCFIVFYCVSFYFNFGSTLTGNCNDVVVFYSQAGWNGSYGGTGARSGGYATACFRVRATACTTRGWRRSQTRWWRWRSTGWMRRSRYERSERPRRRIPIKISAFSLCLCLSCVCYGSMLLTRRR